MKRQKNPVRPQVVSVAQQPEALTHLAHSSLYMPDGTLPGSGMTRHQLGCNSSLFGGAVTEGGRPVHATPTCRRCRAGDDEGAM